MAAAPEQPQAVVAVEVAVEVEVEVEMEAGAFEQGRAVVEAVAEAQDGAASTSKVVRLFTPPARCRARSDAGAAETPACGSGLCSGSGSSGADSGRSTPPVAGAMYASCSGSSGDAGQQATQQDTPWFQQLLAKLAAANAAVGVSQAPPCVQQEVQQAQASCGGSGLMARLHTAFAAAAAKGWRPVQGGGGAGRRSVGQRARGDAGSGGGSGLRRGPRPDGTPAHGVCGGCGAGVAAGAWLGGGGANQRPALRAAAGDVLTHALCAGRQAAALWSLLSSAQQQCWIVWGCTL